MRLGMRVSNGFQEIMLGTILAASACGSNNLLPEGGSSKEERPSEVNVVKATDPMADKSLKLDGEAVRFLSEGRLAEEMQNGSVLSASSIAGQKALTIMASESGSTFRSDPGVRFETQEDHNHPAADGSLVMGFPRSLLGRPFLFGAVITKVSDHETEDLGNLKLTDLPPFIVKPSLGTVTGTSRPGLVLKGCSADCTTSSPVQTLITLPVAAVDEANNMIMVNIADLGRGLNLVSMIDPDGSFTNLTERSSQAAWADFSQNTLLFDVDSTMTPIGDDAEDRPDVVVTVRWYLRPEAITHAQFQARSQTDGVGFFTTSLGATERITRFAKPSEGGAVVKYYIKNVPVAYQNDFRAVFSSWNTALQGWGVDLRLESEVIGLNDPLNELITTGDVRYNVIEWDIVNRATYGGLGPSIAHQITGETINGSVLIQGPEIIRLYTRWFNASTNSDRLRERGLVAEADKELRDAQTEIELAVATNQKAARISRKLTSAHGLQFRIVADMPQLQDDVVRMDFETWPSATSFASYMSGYWLDTAGHEVGHNLGLRHNFRGSLGGSATPESRRVSRSIMEYLPITHRYLDFVGPYDEQALKYGYMGQAPTHLDWFCTDEDKAATNAPTNSAECTTDDANTDPFLYFETKLNKAIDFMVAPRSADAPTWVIANLVGQVDKAAIGLFSYAASASATASSWTNWRPGHPERPTTPAAIKTFVVQRVKDAICAPRIAEAIAAKQTQAGRDAATRNINDLRTEVKKIYRAYGLGTTTSALNCPN